MENLTIKDLLMLANLPSLSDVKRDAKTMAKYNKMKYKDALNLSAQSYGFTDYKSAQSFMNGEIKRPPVKVV